MLESDRDAGSHELDEELLPARQDQYGAVTLRALVGNFVLMGWTAFGGTNGCIALLETVRSRHMSSNTYFGFVSLDYIPNFHYAAWTMLQRSTHPMRTAQCSAKRCAQGKRVCMAAMTGV